MQVFVPFDARQPKTRLGGVLDADEREAFARAMLCDVIGALTGAGYTPTVLASAQCDFASDECVGLDDIPVRIDERPLTPAVNAVLTEHSPTAIVMADLPLLTPQTVDRLFTTTGEVVLAPGLGGGTNALVSRHPEFRVDYHDGSYRKHTDAAQACGAEPIAVDSFRCGIDVDEPTDLTEVLLHSDGNATRWLRTQGFRLATGDRGLRARRTSE